jgi:hypothetical protein
MKDQLKELRSFAKIWNASKSFVTNFDLERAFGKDIATIRQMVDDYHVKQLEHPSLPELIWRKETGQPISIPAHALRQLDKFRIDRHTVKKAQGVIVTSAQFGANIHEDFWKTLNVCAEYRNFPLVVMPIKYGPIHYIDGQLTSTFPDALKGHLLFENLTLGKNQINLNVARMRPTLERFLTDTVCRMGGNVSQVFASPALELEHRASLNDDYPKAIMTTGSVSTPNYGVDRLGQQDRTGEVAMMNHVLSAIIIEFDGKDFHFRQLCANEKGEFYDIDPINGGARYFTPEGHTHKPDAVEALVLGDWHTGKTCPDVRKATFGKKGMTDQLNPKNIVLHDFIDGDSVSHYEQYQASRRAWKAERMFDSMEIELQNGVKEIAWIQSRVPYAKLHMVASNHPEFLTEYVEEMKWAKDNINLRFGALMFAAMVNDLVDKNPKKVEAIASDPVILYFRKHCPNVNTLERTDKLLLGNGSVLCSMHGDIGTRGAPTRSLKEFHKWNIDIILGHNHTGTIWGPTWRVGTSTPKMQFYVTTPTTQWTNTHCAVFDNGQRMLLNIVNKKFHGYKLNSSTIRISK